MPAPDLPLLSPDNLLTLEEILEKVRSRERYSAALTAVLDFVKKTDKARLDISDFIRTAIEVDKSRISELHDHLRQANLMIETLVFRPADTPERQAKQRERAAMVMDHIVTVLGVPLS